jgi:hypothetical protein
MQEAEEVMADLRQLNIHLIVQLLLRDLMQNFPAKAGGDFS